MLENSKRKGEKFPALPTAWAKADGKASKAGLPPEARVGFANSFGPCCWQS
jgi:hypothetical protein